MTVKNVDSIVTYRFAYYKKNVFLAINYSKTFLINYKLVYKYKILLINNASKILEYIKISDL